MMYQIVQGDFLEVPIEKPVALVVTSPPYNLGKDYGEGINDKLPYQQYLQWTKTWLRKAYGCVSDGGRLCLNLPVDTCGSVPVYVDVVNLAREVGWKYFTTIYWNEGNVSKRTAWGSWRRQSAPYVTQNGEMILVMYKGPQWKRAWPGGQVELSAEEFMDWTLGTWTFPNSASKKSTGHPAAFPVELPRRLIKLFSFKGDTVLDPFVGSGATLVAAEELGRDSIGVDMSKEYCEIAQKRMEKV